MWPAGRPAMSEWGARASAMIFFSWRSRTTALVLWVLEQALFLHPLLEGLERRFDLVLDNLYSHEGA
jgi:hypothetical protein